ncbi:aryl-alcohol dehydrogenase-like predicted oxidoreductase [Aeromicrobium panaciterrae]|uniref:Aryl-alcohol dehydrogenase-like predicted oxidoreductase n=1 Tax=Aeromicrobium panaciterrae TaxID=363861 RepID=A0ABU1UND4_9ACTN|nr:aldo/keto reductase [Aeromicrobium panaciterrae]MDR7086668.1 aryl-alcohol dehydrogenase-like predicted oxidoreductase [Aeromicrobium panaciterrae]
MTRTLGSSDIKVSTVGVGCNAFGTRIDQDQTTAVVDACFEHGVNFFDTADVYGESEVLLGKALEGRRDEVIIATKFGMDLQGRNGDDQGRRGSAAYVKTAIDASLKRLGTDHIDLYQLHTPDPQTPIEETLGALNELVVEGKVRAIGSSNLQAWQAVDADWVSKTKGFASFVTAQNEYSLYNRTAETELVPACLELGVGILPYFPLAYGLLTGKYRRGEQAPEGTRLAVQTHRLEAANWDTIEALEAFANARSISILDLAIGGLAAQPAVASVIAGATKPEQVAANAKAGEWTPSDSDLEELALIGKPDQSYTTFA